MSSFARFQSAIVAFVGGLAHFWSGRLAVRLARAPRIPRWRLFPLITSAQRFAQWRLVAGAIKRWRVPIGIMLLAIVGATALLSRIEQPASQPAAAEPLVVLNAADNVAGGEGAGIVPEAIEIDPRELARQQAEAQRYQQGLSLLIVLGVVAVVWIGLARYAGAR